MMEEDNDIDLETCKVDDKTWNCPICYKCLSRKQTLKDHLWNIHKRKGKTMFLVNILNHQQAIH